MTKTVRTTTIVLPGFIFRSSLAGGHMATASALPLDLIIDPADAAHAIERTHKRAAADEQT